MKFAVAVIEFFSSELIIEFHEGTSWKDALMKHSKVSAGYELDDFIETAKQDAFDGDWRFDVKEIK
jgi:hypothetical protein